MNDKSANERLALNQKIVQKESEIDDFQQIHRDVEKALNEFEIEMRSHFQRLQDSYETMMAMGSSKAKWEEADRQSKQAHLVRMLAENRDELGRYYIRTLQNLDEEKNQLQKERDDLPWD
ncbi:TPA: hypothetical protein ACHU7H_001179 [Streptococcus suis]|nr:hypothetical protein [Streptococcus suis]